jgi:hypothetical protein
MTTTPRLITRPPSMTNAVSMCGLSPASPASRAPKPAIDPATRRLTRFRNRNEPTAQLLPRSLNHSDDDVSVKDRWRGGRYPLIRRFRPNGVYLGHYLGAGIP